jgi:hypothetical protein
MHGVADLWREANAALPPGWTLQGLRCASIGLTPRERCDGWVAEACGPNGGCERFQDESPLLALSALTRRLRELQA